MQRTLTQAEKRKLTTVIKRVESATVPADVIFQAFLNTYSRDSRQTTDLATAIDKINEGVRLLKSLALPDR